MRERRKRLVDITNEESKEQDAYDENCAHVLPHT